MYDSNNIFARILRGEIPSQKVRETEHTLVIRDAFPQVHTHVLVIPKGSYVSFVDFTTEASEAEIVDFMRTLGQAAKELGIAETGARLITNHGVNGGQEVPHFHVHLLGGEPLGPMLSHRSR